MSCQTPRIVYRGPGAVTDRETARGDVTYDQPLTPRQAQILRLLAEGLDRPSVARQMGTSRSTVGVQLQMALAKSGARNTTHLVVLLAAHDKRS